MENFDANYDRAKQRDDYDVIITTEVLAEGINLHRANTILNYDTPWNATHLIQRIGRINRIGSPYQNIYVYNFYPSAQGDHVINLVQNAFTKLQSFHTLFGEDSRIYSDEEELERASDNSMLMKQIDGEESPIQKHIRALEMFKKTHPARYEWLLHADHPTECTMMSDGVKDDNFVMIKTSQKNKGGIYFKSSDNDGTLETTQVSSIIDFFDCVRCDEKTPYDGIVKTDAGRIRDDALKKYEDMNNRQFKEKNRTKNDKALGEAKCIIQRLNNVSIIGEAKELLSRAKEYLRGGDLNVVPSVKALQEIIDNPLFIGAEEKNDKIIRSLGYLKNCTEKKSGKPYVYAALYKVTPQEQH